ncbi:MAG TPA: PH domain-containing protein [Streptosporangiaceae bacterium]|nr:PH domain-containing protein [Streptosporangiaceae bacterium]
MEREEAVAPMLPGLRDPSNRVSRRAVGYWTARAAADGLCLLAAEIAVAAGTGFGLGWWIALAVTLLAVAAYALIMPRWRYRVHRWEVTGEAVYTRTGWISVHWRIAPISRIQTIDSHRWFGERLFGLANVTATTASAAGPVHIRGLDRGTADRLLDQLTAATGQVPGDAT